MLQYTVVYVCVLFIWICCIPTLCILTIFNKSFDTKIIWWWRRSFRFKNKSSEKNEMARMLCKVTSLPSQTFLLKIQCNCDLIDYFWKLPTPSLFVTISCLIASDRFATAVWKLMYISLLWYENPCILFSMCVWLTAVLQSSFAHSHCQPRVELRPISDSMKMLLYYDLLLDTKN